MFPRVAKPKGSATKSKKMLPSQSEVHIKLVRPTSGTARYQKPGDDSDAEL